MSKHARTRPTHRTRIRTQGRFAPVEQELTQGFVEVATTGISLGRFLEVYATLVRAAWASTLSSVRSLVRPAASSEA